MINLCQEVMTDQKLFDSYQKKYNEIISWYNYSYNEYHELLLDNIKNRKETGTLPEVHGTTLSYGAVTEGLLKLLLSKYSKYCNRAFFEKYQMAYPAYDNRQLTWLDEKCKINFLELIEILAKVLYEEKEKPRFDLKALSDDRQKRNIDGHIVEDIIPLSSYRAYNNIREMILFLDGEIKLPMFDTPPQMFDYQAFAEKCNNFDFTDCVSILIIDSLHDISESKREIVANLKWDYVIDLDGYSDFCGLRSSVKHDRINDVGFATNDFLPEKVNWIRFGEQQLCYHVKKEEVFDYGRRSPAEALYNTKRNKTFTSSELIKNIISPYYKSEYMVLVIAMTDDLDFAQKAVAQLRDIDDEEPDCFMFIHVGLAKVSVNFDSSDKRFCSFYSPIEQVFEAFSQHQKQFDNYIVKKKISQYTLPSDGSEVEISELTRYRLEQYFDVLYKNCENLYDLGSDENLHLFFRGGIATWDILQKKQIVQLYTDYINKIKNAVRRNSESEKNTKIFHISHIPGFGGTTIARQIAWEIHNEFPVLCVKKYDGEIKEVVKDLYDNCLNKQPIILLADDTLSNLNSLCKDVIEIKRRCIMIVSCRNGIKLPTQKTELYKLGNISDDEIAQLRIMFEKELRREKGKLKANEKLEIIKNIVEDEAKYYNNPFMIGLLYMEDDYDVDNYVNKALAYSSDSCASAIACLALCDEFGCKDVPKTLIHALAGIESNRVNFTDKNPSFANLICRIEKSSRETFYRFQHFILSEKYLKAFIQRFYYNSSKEEAYFDLSKLIIKKIASLPDQKESYLNLLIDLLIINKSSADGFDDRLSGLLSAIKWYDKRTELLRLLAQDFEAKIKVPSYTNNIFQMNTNEMAYNIKKLVSHAYAHLARLMSMDNKNAELADEYIDKAVRINDSINNPVIYHMAADSKRRYLHNELKADKKIYALDLDVVEIRIEKIIDYYDQTSEFGSPEYGLYGKLLLYNDYFEYLFERLQINDEQDWRNYLRERDTLTEFRMDYIATFEYLDAVVLNDSIRQKVEVQRERYDRLFIINNEDKSVEYYKLMMEKTENVDSEKFVRAVCGLVFSRVRQAKKAAANDRVSFYEKMDNRVLDDLYIQINKVVKILNSSDVSGYASYCRISTLFHRYVQICKLLGKPIEDVLGVIQLWEDMPLSEKYSPEPFYHHATILYAKALFGNPLSLESAKTLSYRIQSMFIENKFINKINRPTSISDILLSSGDGMNRIMDVSYCSNDEEILKECGRRGVIPVVVKGVFVKSLIPNKLALLEVQTPLSLKGTKVHLELGASNKNDLNSSCEGKLVECILGFCYEYPKALSYRARLSKTGEALEVDSIIKSVFSEAKKPSYKNQPLFTESARFQSVPNQPVVLVGDSVKFHPMNLNTDSYSQITYLNGKVEGFIAGVSEKDIERYGEDVIKASGGMNEILEKLKNKDDIPATVLEKRGNRLALSIYDANPDLYYVLYDTAEVKKIEQPICTNNEEQSINLLPNLNQKIVEVTIENCSQKTANAKLEHEGKCYPVLINGINNAQRKRLKKGTKTKVKIVSNQKQYTAKLQS